MTDARTRLVDSMRDGLQRRGLHGIGMTEILQGAQAPKGVMYYHFPGGKSELAVAAIQKTVDDLALRLNALLSEADDPLDAMDRWLAGAARHLAKGDFERGCPLATVSLESTAADSDLRSALSSAFARLRGIITEALRGAGLEPALSTSVAALIVAAYEGGLLQSRVAQSPETMIQVNSALMAAVRAMAARKA